MPRRGPWAQHRMRRRLDHTSRVGACLAVLCLTRRQRPIDLISIPFTEFLMSKIDLGRRRIVQALAFRRCRLPLAGYRNAYAADSLAALPFRRLEESHRKILLPAFRKASARARAHASQASTRYETDGARAESAV